LLGGVKRDTFGAAILAHAVPANAAAIAMLRHLRPKRDWDLLISVSPEGLKVEVKRFRCYLLRLRLLIIATY
jgi:hypothetical protein